MILTIESFANGHPIPPDFAFGVPGGATPIVYGGNRNPHLVWTDVPEGTRSFALVCHDPDVPSVGTDVNQPDRSVPFDLPRVDFYHWVMVDIPADVRELPAGCDCDGVTPGGKDVGKTPYGVRGINSYTSWFSGDPDMAGNYGGYDGPCPPYNDERVHHYHFTLYALDIETLGLSGVFDGADALLAMKNHVLASSEWVGTYTINPTARLA